MHPIEVLNCHQVPLKVLAKELVIGAERKYFLLAKLALDEILHLLDGELTIFKHGLDMLQRALLLQVILLLNDIEPSFEDSFDFACMSDFYSFGLWFLFFFLALVKLSIRRRNVNVFSEYFNVLLYRNWLRRLVRVSD